MNSFIVNGIERSSSIPSDAQFRDLMEYVHRNLTGDQQLVSCIRINGMEITNEEEQALAGILLCELDSVEVTLTHPRELAEETLQTLRVFVGDLASLSMAAAESLRTGPEAAAQTDIAKLLDGIEMLMDAMTTVRTIFRVGIMPTVNILEADLASIMKDILDAREDEKEYRLQLLNEYLPENLRKWADEAIPELMRSRDS